MSGHRRGLAPLSSPIEQHCWTGSDIFRATIVGLCWWLVLVTARSVQPEAGTRLQNRTEQQWDRCRSVTVASV